MSVTRLAEDERQDLPDGIIAAARSLFDRGGLTHGSTGNISFRVGARILITPTGSSLGTVKPSSCRRAGSTAATSTDPKPSKEAFLHAATLRA